MGYERDTHGISTENIWWFPARIRHMTNQAVPSHFWSVQRLNRLQNQRRWPRQAAKLSQSQHGWSGRNGMSCKKTGVLPGNRSTLTIWEKRWWNGREALQSTAKNCSINYGKSPYLVSSSSTTVTIRERGMVYFLAGTSQTKMDDD